MHHRASTATSRVQVTQAVSTEPPAQRQFVRPTRFAHPHSWSQPTKTPTFPHHHTEKSPHQQHVVSYNLVTYPRRDVLSCYRTSRVGRWSVPGAADGCAQFRGGLIGPRGGTIGSRGGTIGRTGGCLGPFTAQVNPTGGSPGRPPTLPPIGPSCAGTGYHYQ